MDRYYSAQLRDLWAARGRRDYGRRAGRRSRSGATIVPSALQADPPARRARTVPGGLSPASPTACARSAMRPRAGASTATSESRPDIVLAARITARFSQGAGRAGLEPRPLGDEPPIARGPPRRRSTRRSRERGPSGRAELDGRKLFEVRAGDPHPAGHRRFRCGRNCPDPVHRSEARAPHSGVDLDQRPRFARPARPRARDVFHLPGRGPIEVRRATSGARRRRRERYATVHPSSVVGAVVDAGLTVANYAGGVRGNSQMRDGVHSAGSHPLGLV